MQRKQVRERLPRTTNIRLFNFATVCVLPLCPQSRLCGVNLNIFDTTETRQRTQREDKRKANRLDDYFSFAALARSGLPNLQARHSEQGQQGRDDPEADHDFHFVVPGEQEVIV